MPKSKEPLSHNFQLSSISNIAIKKLGGFKESHQVPKDINSATKRFVHNCAAKDIEQELENIWELCRQEFKYKRKDKLNLLIEEGQGILSLADFRFSIRVQQDEEDPRSVVWHRSIDEIKNLQLVLSAPFNTVFAKNFNTLETAFLESPMIEKLIDRVEDLDSTKITVKYPMDCSSCEIFIKPMGLLIYVDSAICRIQMPYCPSPKILFAKILEIQNLIQSREKEDPLSTLLLSKQEG